MTPLPEAIVEAARAVDIVEVAQRLGLKLRREGREFVAPVPWREDAHPSLRINPLKNRWFDNPKGENGDGIELWMRVRRVDFVTAVSELTQGSDQLPGGEVYTNGSRPRIVARYHYVDEDGEPLFRVVRKENKGFSQERLEGGKWIPGLGDTRRVLYRLPQLVEAVAMGRAIYIAEGEKDVEAIEKAGGTATCNPGGVGMGWRPEYSESLRGAHVVIVADRDEPDDRYPEGKGRWHAKQVAECLSGIAASVEIREAREGKDAHDHLAAGYGLDEFGPLEATQPETVEPPLTLRPSILVRNELNRVTEEAVAAIEARPDLGVFVRGRMLVTVGRDGSPPDRWLRRPPGSPVIVPIEQARMLSILDTAATWQKRNRKEKRLVTIRPPVWVANQILARLQWPFPYLEAVTETPTLRRDGSVLDTPGWDEDTGLLFEPLPGVKWPEVPAQPTRAELRQAVELLLDPVRDFPFLAASDRAAYIAAVLSLLGRHMINGPVPLFPIRAPTPGTEKGLLAAVIGFIGSGRIPPIMPMTHNADELRKRVHSLAVDGTPLVLLDNLSGSIGSDVLAAALTANEWDDRILGKTRMVRAPLRTVWLATGNNLSFRKTLGRRVVPIDLDARVEVPEDRTDFAYPDLMTHVQSIRPQLIGAALTILRGFHRAGRPTHGVARMGSFEAWDDLVRSAVVWAGLGDPASTEEGAARGRIRANADDDLEGLSALLETLASRFPNAVPFSTAQVVSQAKDDEDMAAVLDTVAAPKRGGRATAHSVGAQFRELQGRPVNGRILRKLGRSWRVETTSGED